MLIVNPVVVRDYSCPMYEIINFNGISFCVIP